MYVVFSGSSSETIPENVTWTSHKITITMELLNVDCFLFFHKTLTAAEDFKMETNAPNS